MWPSGAMGESPANTHRIFAPCHRFRRAGINSFQWRSIADCRLTFTSHFRLGFDPIVEIVTIPFATETSLKKRPRTPIKRNSTRAGSRSQCLPLLVNLSKMNS